MKFPKDLKGFKPTVYLRISTNEQSQGDSKKPLAKQQAFKNQLSRIKDFLKTNGLSIPKDEDIFYELASGGDPTRPVLKQAINRAVNRKGKGMFVVAEMSRFHRDLRYGMKDTIPLYENEVPMLITDDSLITGTKNSPEGDSDILMGLKVSLSTGERERQRKRVKASIDTKTKQGIYVSKGLVLHPNADGDIYQYIIDNLDKAVPVKEGGIGVAQFLRQLEVVYGNKTPFSTQFVRVASDRIRKLKMDMTPEEFQEWNNFRKRILEMERMFGVDDWKMKAVRYRSNGYITDPLNVNFSIKPSEEVIQNAIDNPQDNLSFKDSKRYRSQVLKRANN